MLDDVPLHVALLSGAVGAVGTGEGLLPRVGAYVGTDAFHLHRLEVTVGAREGLLEGVCAEVLAQLGGDGGSEGTVWAVVETRGVGRERRRPRTVPLRQQSDCLDVVFTARDFGETHFHRLLRVPRCCCCCCRHLPTWLTYSL